jgi:hypothetical protein
MRASKDPTRKARDRVGSVDPSSEPNAASRDASVAEYKVPLLNKALVMSTRHAVEPTECRKSRPARVPRPPGCQVIPVSPPHVPLSRRAASKQPASARDDYRLAGKINQFVSVYARTLRRLQSS